MLQRILVTGANKGVGLAIVEKILEIRPASFVYLGSRDRARGEAALAGVIERNPAALGRVKVIELDVTSVASVAAAASRVAAEGYLYGLVNNAGGFLESASDMFELNLFSQKRVTDAFAGTLDPAGSRIVFISSGAAPMTVAKCSPERRVSLTRRDSTWADVEAAAREYLVCTNATEACAAGFPDPTDPWSSYGLSKALLNKYVLALSVAKAGSTGIPAGCFVNACTPGMIETDLLVFAVGRTMGKTPAEVGALPPAAGTVAPLRLLFGPLASSGQYFGSDGLRSPMGTYRSPGSPEYDGPDA